MHDDALREGVIERLEVGCGEIGLLGLVAGEHKEQSHAGLLPSRTRGLHYGDSINQHSHSVNDVYIAYHFRYHRLMENRGEASLANILSPEETLDITCLLYTSDAAD